MLLDLKASSNTVKVTRFTSLEAEDHQVIPPEQKENIQQFLSDLQNSVDSLPSPELISQWIETVQLAWADQVVELEELQAISQATADIFDGMGLTHSEVRTLVYDLQNIGEASQAVREDEYLMGTEANDWLTGKLGADTLLGTPTDGTFEVDVLIGGGGTDTFVLGNETTTFYNDGFKQTEGLADYALIVDFNLAQDTIKLHGTAENYTLGALPEPLGLQGTGLYWHEGDHKAELVGVIMGVEVADFSSGFTFVG